MGFGLRLKAILDEKNITPTQLGQMTGINRQRIYSWIKRDTEKIDPEVFTIIAAALNIDVDVLLHPATRTNIVLKIEERLANLILLVPNTEILLDLTPEELTRVIDFAQGLIAARPEKKE